MNNTFGTLFSVTTAGESHGPALIGIVDGMPAGIKIDFEAIEHEMAQRRPGQPGTSTRSESDSVEFLSGLLDGVTLGTPIAFMIRNCDKRSEDYEQMAKTFRPSHADFTYQSKYGIRDPRGGGRASARETALRVVAGALALQALSLKGITINAYTSRIGDCTDGDFSAILERMKKEGDTVGCVISCEINGLRPGIGEPIYNKLSARLAYAMFSINAVHGFDYGTGFDMACKRGSEMTDTFIIDDNGAIATASNHSGGIQGGISNGMPVTFRVAFKPLPTMMRPVESVDKNGKKIIIELRGRHDVCAAPRAVPVVRAMAAITVLDLLLQSECRKRFL